MDNQNSIIGILFLSCFGDVDIKRIYFLNFHAFPHFLDIDFQPWNSNSLDNLPLKIAAKYNQF